MIYNDLIDRLAARRCQYGLQLADVARVTRINAQTISLWERRARKPRIHEYMQLLRLYGLDLVVAGVALPDLPEVPWLPITRFLRDRLDATLYTNLMLSVDTGYSTTALSNLTNLKNVPRLATVVDLLGYVGHELDVVERGPPSQVIFEAIEARHVRRQQRLVKPRRPIEIPNGRDLIRAYQSGLSLRTVAAQHGQTLSTVWRYLQRHGVVRRRAVAAAE